MRDAPIPPAPKAGPMPAARVGIKHALRHLPADEKGGFLVFFALALVAFMGMVALAFDLARAAATHTDMQSFADTVALAAAGELDGMDDSIDRARLAAQTLIVDQQLFGEDGEPLTTDDRDLDSADFTLTFLSALPSNDSYTDDSGDIICTGLGCVGASAAAQRSAIYVRVDVTPHTVRMDFASVLNTMQGGGRMDASIDTTATAGNTQYACAITSMMFCLPSATYGAEENIGNMVVLRSGGNGSAWGPGDFGFIDPTNLAIDPNGPCVGLTGASLWTCLVGADGALTQCVVSRGQLMTEPGQRDGVAEAAINVRFDIFRSSMKGEASDLAYRPAPNVLKGVMRQGGPSTGNACLGMETDPTGNTMGLPRDTCILDGSCTRFGNGVWDVDTYVDTNHNGEAPPLPSTYDADLVGTRYQMYLNEIELAGGPGVSDPIVPATDTKVDLTLDPPLDCINNPADERCIRWTTKADGSVVAATETGRPMCSAYQSSDPERRVIIAAGVDCGTYPVSGKSPVVVQEFFKIFLTEPARDDGASPPNVDIIGEIIGSAGIQGGTSGVFHEVVQLYR